MDGNIPEKMYSEAKRPSCPNCEDPLVFDDLGAWYCESCDYFEWNNITKCQGECDNLVLSRDMNFDRLEDQYCCVKQSDGFTCLSNARHESDQADAEYYELKKHQDHCRDKDCDCRNY